MSNEHKSDLHRALERDTINIAGSTFHIPTGGSRKQMYSPPVRGERRPVTEKDLPAAPTTLFESFVLDNLAKLPKNEHGHAMIALEMSDEEIRLRREATMKDV
jgi:hypothetical protein